MKEYQEDLKEGGKEVNTNKNETEEGEVKSPQIVCPICNKTFNSGKAFGGHKSSAHVQSKGQKSCSKKLIKRKYNNNSGKSVVGYDDFVDEDGDYYYYYSERLIGKTGFDKKRKFGITCDHCNKDFPSKKALFGHMRCHPDRPYRGMEAPDSNNINDDVDDVDDVDFKHSSMISHEVKRELEEEVEEEDEDEDEDEDEENEMGMGTSEAKATPVVDLAKDLVGVGWTKKGKRGGGDETIAKSSSAMADMSDSISNNQLCNKDSDVSFEERHLASQLLMYLHDNGRSKSNLDNTNVVGEATSMANPMASPSDRKMELLLDFALSKKRAEKSEQYSSEEEEVAGVMNQLTRNKGKSIAILENGKDNNSSDGTNSDYELVRKLDYARKGKEKIVETKRRKTKCYDANKKVMIKWNKLSSSAMDGDFHDIFSPPSAAAPPPPPPPPPQPVIENGRAFVCSTCGKIFPTHQALGGHKSSHNKFKMVIENTIQDVVEDNEDIESPSSKGRRIAKKRKKAAAEVPKKLDFDLNQLPEEES